MDDTMTALPIEYAPSTSSLGTPVDPDYAGMSLSPMSEELLETSGALTVSRGDVFHADWAVPEGSSDSREWIIAQRRAKGEVLASEAALRWLAELCEAGEQPLGTTPEYLLSLSYAGLIQAADGRVLPTIEAFEFLDAAKAFAQRVDRD